MVTTLPGITGLGLVLTLVVIAVFASRHMRYKQHNRFLATHHMFIIYYGLLLIHAINGVIKYQTNLDEHTPGCWMVLNKTGNDSSALVETLILPEPEPHAEPMPSVKKHMLKKYEERAVLKKESDSQQKWKYITRVNDTSSITKFHMLKEIAKDVRHQVIFPEPEPISHDGDIPSKQKTNFLVVEKMLMRGVWVDVIPCNQPQPTFASCPKETWIWLILPLTLYLVERFIRLFYITRVPTTIVDFKQHPSNVIELKLSQKGFKAKPGQNIWLRCPSISRIELHPFSLTSVPCEEDSTFSVHIKVLGDWTSQLLKILIQRQVELNNSKEERKRTSRNDFYLTTKSPFPLCNREDNISNESLMLLNQSTLNVINEQVHTNKSDRKEERHDESFQGSICGNKVTCDRSISKKNTVEQKLYQTMGQDILTKEFQLFLPPVFVEGPTGSAMEDVYKYKISLCVAGGIGITPFASVLNAMLKDKSLRQNMKLERMYLYWACRSIESFEWFANLIEELLMKLWDNGLPDLLNVHLFLTGTQPQKMESIASNIPHISKLKRCRISYARPNISEIFQTMVVRHPW